MIGWDMEGLMIPVNLEQFRQSVTEQPLCELEVIYGGLVRLVDICTHMANVPEVTVPLSELSYVYAVEIAYRHMTEKGLFWSDTVCKGVDKVYIPDSQEGTGRSGKIRGIG